MRNKQAEQLQETLGKLTDAEIGKRFREYIKETNHQGWEFNPRHMNGIRVFCQDVDLFLVNYSKGRCDHSGHWDLVSRDGWGNEIRRCRDCGAKYKVVD